MTGLSWSESIQMMDFDVEQLEGEETNVISATEMKESTWFRGQNGNGTGMSQQPSCTLSPLIRNKRSNTVSG